MNKESVIRYSIIMKQDRPMSPELVMTKDIREL